jgi:hypothetical protein
MTAYHPVVRDLATAMVKSQGRGLSAHELREQSLRMHRVADAELTRVLEHLVAFGRALVQASEGATETAVVRQLEELAALLIKRVRGMRSAGADASDRKRAALRFLGSS